MTLKLLTTIALMLAVSAANAQTSRDITRIPSELANPPIATLCLHVRPGTEEALTAVSGAVTDLGALRGIELRITVASRCFRQKPGNLTLLVAPASVPRGSVPPQVIANAIPLESWTSGTATFLTKVRRMDWVHSIEPDPIVILKFSIGTRNFSSALTEAQFITLQNGGTIAKPPVR